MSEFTLELYSEEIPPKLQISARNQLKELIEKALLEENIKYKSIFSYSSPTRLLILIKKIPEKITIPAKEIRGPKVGVLDDILNRFIRSHNASKKDILEKEIDKGRFYFIRIKAKEILTKDLLTKVVLNSIASINWKKSMKWGNHSLMWGRPLRSILAVYNKKILPFKYGHLKSTNVVVIEHGLVLKQRKINNFNEYKIFFSFFLLGLI